MTITSIQYKETCSEANIDRLKYAICKAYNISDFDDLLLIRRYDDLVKPRQMFYYIAIEKFGMKVREAGMVFNQDHSSAIHSRDKVRDLLSIMDEETHDKLELISEYLK